MSPEEEKIEDEIKEALNNLQTILIQNVYNLKKGLSSSFSPVVFTAGLIVLIGGGLVLSLNLFLLNILALVLALVVFAGLLIVRYFSFIRATNSASEYISLGTPLKSPKEINLLKRFITFTSPQDVYEAAVSELDEEWLPLIPIFEESLEIINDSEKENS